MRITPARQLFSFECGSVLGQRGLRNGTASGQTVPGTNENARTSFADWRNTVSRPFIPSARRAIAAILTILLNVGAVAATRADDFQTIFFFPTNSPYGSNPIAGLAQVGSTLYGTAAHGGGSGHGAIYSINQDGSNYQNVYSFTAAAIRSPISRYRN